jgi:DNA-binding transcriptional LysR family regulator
MPVDAPDLSLAQLRCFVAVVDSGSFAAAGRRLGLSTSVVSKTIARLEAAHGTRLLHRSTHSVSATEAGRGLVDVARTAIGALEDVAAALDAEGDRAGGWVRLTAPLGLLRHCLIPLLPALRREHPDIRLDLRSSNAFLDLADHGIDLAIRSGSLDRVPGHVQQRWFECPWVVCASPAYLSARVAPSEPAGLAAHDLLGFRASEDGLVRPWWFRHAETGERVRWMPDPVLTFDDGEAGWRAALDGVGIARAPLFLAAEALRRGEMIELLADWRDAAMPVSLLRREARLAPPRVERLIAFLRRNPPPLDPA